MIKDEITQIFDSVSSENESISAFLLEMDAKGRFDVKSIQRIVILLAEKIAELEASKTTK